MDLVTEQKLERRARILAEARDLIAERGFREVTMRELARRCRVSVPTLYNWFGSKDELLGAAVEDQFRSLLGALEPRTDSIRGNPLAVLELVERCADEMARLSGYHRSLLRAFADAGGETGPLEEQLAGGLAIALTAELTAMQGRRVLEPWVAPGMLAMQLTTTCISSAVIWSRGGVGDAGLRASMIYGVSLLLLAGARGDLRPALQSRAEEAQADLESELKVLPAADDSGRRSAGSPLTRGRGV